MFQFLFDIDTTNLINPIILSDVYSIFSQDEKIFLSKTDRAEQFPLALDGHCYFSSVLRKVNQGCSTNSHVLSWILQAILSVSPFKKRAWITCQASTCDLFPKK